MKYYLLILSVILLIVGVINIEKEKTIDVLQCALILATSSLILFKLEKNK